MMYFEVFSHILYITIKICGMRTQVTQELIDNIIGDYKDGSSIETLCNKFHLGKLKVKTILDDNGVHRRSYTESKEINRLPEDRAPKYIPIEGKHYVCTCTVDGYQTNDYENRGGFLTTHIKNVLGIEIPTLWDRKKYYNETGNYWWEQWFNVELVDDKPTIKCPYCGWTSEDVDNRSGMFETHLKKVHGVDKVTFVTEHPEWREYFRTANQTIDRQMETDESKFVVCKVCGKKLSRIDWKHLQSHGLTKLEYMEQYGGKIHSESLYNKSLVQCKHMNESLTGRNDIFTSRYEQDILAFITSIGFECGKDRSILHGAELDIFIPEKRVAIEFNGCKWHTETFGKKDANYHLNKTLQCEAAGVRLIHIFEDEWLEHRDIVKDKLRTILGCNKPSKTIYGRNVTVSECLNSKVEALLTKYHIQGPAASTVTLKAEYHGETVAAMLFTRDDTEGNWQLVRYVTNTTYSCPGVAGKMLHWFIRKYNPHQIKSFADRRWTQHNTGNLYEKLGFKFDGYTKPDYRYYNDSISTTKRFHKFNFRKQHLARRYGFSTDMTESEMVKQLGYDRIWDCGLIRYLWVKDNTNASKK